MAMEAMEGTLLEQLEALAGMLTEYEISIFA
jgi:hypothetical protein